MKKLLFSSLFAFSLVASAGDVFNTEDVPIGGSATDVASLITAPCNTANAILYNATTPCSANLSFNSTGSKLTLGTDVVLSRYAAKQLLISGDGTGATTNAGWIIGYGGLSGVSNIWSSTLETPNSNNVAISISDSTTGIGAANIVNIGVNGVLKASFSGTAGAGPSITAGTATTDVNALNITQTWNNAAVVFTGLKQVTTRTAQASNSKLFDFSVAEDTNQVKAVVNGAAMDLIVVGGNGGAGRIVLNGNGSSNHQIVSPGDGTALTLDSYTAGISLKRIGTEVAGFTATAGSGLNVAAGTATTNVKALDISQTWNNAAVTFTGKLNAFTDTASNAASLLENWTVGGISKFSITKAGRMIASDGSQASPSITTALSGAAGFYSVSGSSISLSGGNTDLWLANAGGIRHGSGVIFGWSSGTSSATAMDTAFSRNAAGVAEVNNGTAGTFRDLKVRQHYVDQTITAGGTTGDQTINKAHFTVNFAAAATAITVTNSLVTTSSTVYCTARTNDATGYVKNAVPAAGSVVINLVAAATAETSVGCHVIN